MTSKNIIAAIILVVVVGAGAFYGGTVYEKSSLAKQNLLRGVNGEGVNGQRRSPGQGGGQGTGMNRGGGQNGGQGDFVAGELISKDDPASENSQNGAGKSITIKTRDGGSKIVYFSDSTMIGKAVSGTSSDLTTGQQVMVNGKSSPDGSLSAQNIQIRPVQ